MQYQAAHTKSKTVHRNKHFLNKIIPGIPIIVHYREDDTKTLSLLDKTMREYNMKDIDRTYRNRV